MTSQKKVRIVSLILIDFYAYAYAPFCNEDFELLINHLVLFAELCGDILRLRPKESDGVENVIVVDGIPQVGDDRLEKLKVVIRKTFTKFGNIVSDEFPTGEDGVSKGYARKLKAEVVTVKQML